MVETKYELGSAQQPIRSHLELCKKTSWGLPEISMRDFVGSKRTFESLEWNNP